MTCPRLGATSATTTACQVARIPCSRKEQTLTRRKGPINGVVGGNGKLLCQDIINGSTGEEESVCDTSLYKTNPATMSSNDFNTAEVTPGPLCEPNLDYTGFGNDLNISNQLNQLDSEP